MKLDLEKLVRDKLHLGRDTRLLELKRSSPDEFCLFVFLATARKPSFVLKGSVHPPRAAELAAEYANLELLSTLGTHGFKNSVPRPVFGFEDDGAFVFAQTCLDGHRVKNLSPGRAFAPEPFQRLLDRMVSWLLAFHRASNESLEPFAAQSLELLVKGAFTNFRQSFQPTNRAEGLLTMAQERLLNPAPGRQAFPKVFLHGDLSTANVIATPDALGVIDWERPLSFHLPLIDLFHFMASCRVAGSPGLPRTNLYERNLMALFFEPGLCRRACAGAVDRYARELALSKELVIPLYVFTWVVMANFKRSYLAARNGTDGADAAPADPNSVFPVTFFLDDSVLNLELLAAHSGEFLQP